jgi:hypothetical protein
VTENAPPEKGKGRASLHTSAALKAKHQPRQRSVDRQIGSGPAPVNIDSGMRGENIGARPRIDSTDITLDEINNHITDILREQAEREARADTDTGNNTDTRAIRAAGRLADAKCLPIADGMSCCRKADAANAS